MLTRRHLRIKALHAFFAYTQADSQDLAKALEELRSNIDGIYELYLYELKIFWHFKLFLEGRLEIEKNKHHPNPAIISNLESLMSIDFVDAMVHDDALVHQWEQRQVNWSDNEDVLKGLFFEYWNTEGKTGWLIEAENPNPQECIVFFKQFYRDWIANQERLHQLYEDMSMHWSDDLDAAQMMVVQTMDNAKKGRTVLVQLFKNDEDAAFAPDLFLQTVKRSSEWKEKMAELASSWDYDRMSPVDRSLVQLALTELVTEKEVPVKVTINEAIELAKQYGSDKSPAFINGLLDAIAKKLIADGVIKKIGRGLLG